MDFNVKAFKKMIEPFFKKLLPTEPNSIYKGCLIYNENIQYKIDQFDIRMNTGEIYLNVVGSDLNYKGEDFKFVNGDKSVKIENITSIHSI